METRHTEAREFAVQHGGARATVVVAIVYLIENRRIIRTHKYTYELRLEKILTSKISPEIRHEFAIVYTTPSVRQSVENIVWQNCTYYSKVPRPVFSPITHTVKYRSSRCIERHAHVIVAFVRDERRAGAALVVAVVVLCATGATISDSSQLPDRKGRKQNEKLTQVVDSPVRVRLRVDLFIVK